MYQQLFKQMKFILGLLLSFYSLATFAQTDTLELYTKQSCGHCKWTKATLTRNQIAYAEYDLADDRNADVMLKRLAAKGYRSMIHLPVILLNDSLIHPTTDTTLSLQRIVNTLLIQQKNGTLHFAKSKPVVMQLNEATSGESDDCVLRKGEPRYVIIQYEFTDKQQASDKLKELHTQGYKFAGMLQMQEKYRIYSQIFTSEEEAIAVLPYVQRKFPEASVFPLK